MGIKTVPEKRIWWFCGFSFLKRDFFYKKNMLSSGLGNQLNNIAPSCIKIIDYL